MVKLFETLLQEASKARFIKELYQNGATSSYASKDIPSQDEMIQFYDKHNEVASTIDWNKKKDEAFFGDLLTKMESFSSKTQDKKNGRRLFDREGFEYIGEDDDFHYIMPLSYEACKFCDSWQCGGQGGEWCIGYEKDRRYYDNYSKHSVFALAFSKNPHIEMNKLKFMIQFEQRDSFLRPEVIPWDQLDNKYEEPEEIRVYREKIFNSKRVGFLLKNIYPKILQIDKERNHSKYFSVGEVSYSIKVDSKNFIEKIQNFKVPKEVELKKPKEDYARIEQKISFVDTEQIPIEVIDKVITALKANYLFSRDTIIEVKNLLIDDPVIYSLPLAKERYDRYISYLHVNELTIDITKTKSLDKFPSGVDVKDKLNIKFPLSVGLQCSCNRLVNKLIGTSSMRSGKIIRAIVNKSVMESGNYFDGYNENITSTKNNSSSRQEYKITKEDVNSEKVIYNALIDASELSKEEILKIKSINSMIIRF